MGKAWLALAACLVPGAGGLPARAGPYIDDLGKCLVESTTADDRADLVRWMFAAATLHPAVGSLASVPVERLEAENRTTAALFTRLLTESCRVQARQAIRYEGTAALGAGFRVLGQVAGQELFSNPSEVQGRGGRSPGERAGRRHPACDGTCS